MTYMHGYLMNRRGEAFCQIHCKSGITVSVNRYNLTVQQDFRVHIDSVETEQNCISLHFRSDRQCAEIPAIRCIIQMVGIANQHIVGELHRAGVLRVNLVIAAVRLSFQEAPPIIELINHGISPV